MLRQHLSPEAKPEKRLLLAQGHADPVDLLLDEVLGIVGAHRAAENHGARMLGRRFGKGIAEAGPSDVERVSALAQEAADPTRRRMLREPLLQYLQMLKEAVVE